MSSVMRWRDTDHLQRAVESAGGQEAFDTAVSQMLDQRRGWRLAEQRNDSGLFGATDAADGGGLVGQRW